MLVSFRVSFYCCLPLVLTSLLFVAEASAIEKFVQLGFVVEHSDNALRSETSPRSDLEQRTELALQLAERSRVLSGLLDYRLDYSDYRRETIEDGESIEGRAELVWHMLPERLNWSVSNVSDDLIRDTRGADTRSNRELRNIFSTGPSLYFAPSRVDDVQIDAEFTRSNFEESTTQDSERLAGQAIWSHRTPYRIRTQLGYRYDEVDYLDSPVQNITGQTVFVGVERSIARGEYMIRLGYNQFDVSNRDDVEGTLAEFNLLYSLPGAHSLEFAAVQTLAETSLGLSGEDVLTTGELSTGDSIARDGVDVVKRTRYDLFYRYDGECRFCDSGVSVFYNKQDFNVLLQDESAYGINPRLSYRSSPHVTWVLDAFISEARFPNEATLREDRLDETTLTMEYQPERRWTFELSAASIRRDSNIVGLDYDDIVGSFTIRYDLFGSESSVSAISSGI